MINTLAFTTELLTFAEYYSSWKCGRPIIDERWP